MYGRQNCCPYFFVFLELHFSNVAIFEKIISENYEKVLTNIDNSDRIYLQTKIKILQGDSIMETKREKFVRLVEARTNKIISMLRLLGNCANKANYDYTDADVQKIFTTLEKELKLAKMKFSSTDIDEDTFKL